ncbi:MAG: hypothetical protein DRP23_05815 [Thermotogae bacterium]|nr:MAG: hypothetical protein DRP23_05815 [Thermotogota bacterium]
MSILFLVLSLLTAVLTLFFPVSIAIPLAFLSVLLFSLSFKRLSHAVLIPLIFSILFLIPAGITNFMISEHFPGMFRFNWMFPQRWEYSAEEQLMKADTEIDGVKELQVEGTGIVFRFEGAEGKVMVPKEIDRKQKDHSLILYGKGKKYEVIAGKLKRLEVNGMGITLRGNIEVEKIELNGTGVLMEGYLSCKNLEVNGMGTKISVNASSCDFMEINGMGVDVFISYTIPWEGKRYIEINGMGSKLVVELPEGVSKDQLEISGGNIASVIKIRRKKK